MIVGYARITEMETGLEEQVAVLKEARCDKIFAETVPDTNAHRPELEQCLNQLQQGDMLVVCRLDRFSRSLAELVQMMTKLRERGIKFTSLIENFKNYGADSELIYEVIHSLYTFQNNLISIRSKEGINRARAKGFKPGRKEGSVNRINHWKPEKCKTLYENGASVRYIKQLLNIKTSQTVYRYLKMMGVSTNGPDLFKSTKLSKKELTQLKIDAYNDSHQLSLFE